MIMNPFNRFPTWLSVILLLPVIFIVNNSYADELNRLFTTKAQRSKLNELRYAKVSEPEPIELVIVEEEPGAGIPEIGGITVNGLVYRKGGKSTAWVNNNNSFEGNLKSQYIEIDANSIDPEKIKLKLPKKAEDITLKVGETYDAETNTVKDITK